MTATPTPEAKEATMSAPTTVGSFTFDPSDSTISGPADYMKSDEYRRCIESIQNGTSSVFRAGMEHSPTPEVALLVTVQTDYAGWHGMQAFNRSRGLS